MKKERRGGKRKGAGRKPRADRDTVKTVPFAGQRWTEAKAQPWLDYMAAHNMTQKQFEEQAFDLLVKSGGEAV